MFEETLTYIFFPSIVLKQCIVFIQQSNIMLYDYQFHHQIEGTVM